MMQALFAANRGRLSRKMTCVRGLDLTRRVVATSFGIAAIGLAIVACSSTTKFSPTPLKPLSASNADIVQAWRSKIGDLDYPLQLNVVGNQLALASSNNSIAVLNTLTGKDAWRVKTKDSLTSGVGFDGHTLVYSTDLNELVAMRSGSVLWRSKMLVRVYTAPLVAGGRVFVLGADRSVYAFDADTGAKLWVLNRPPEPLSLSQAGSLSVFKETILAGGSGRLLALNPKNGAVVWELPIASNRATNDIERLSDLVGLPHRVDNSVCVRAYQMAIACLDADKSQIIWSKPSAGGTGVSGDATMVVSTDFDGRLKAWNRSNGDLLWTVDALAHRGLSAPLLIGNSVVVGDAQGYVHVLSKADGHFTARFQTNGSAVVAAPVVAGQVVIVATLDGSIFAYSPQ